MENVAGYGHLSLYNHSIKSVMTCEIKKLWLVHQKKKIRKKKKKKKKMGMLCIAPAVLLIWKPAHNSKKPTPKTTYNNNNVKKNAKRLICLFLSFIIIFSLGFWACCYFSLVFVPEVLMSFLFFFFSQNFLCKAAIAEI